MRIFDVQKGRGFYGKKGKHIVNTCMFTTNAAIKMNRTK